MAHYDVVVVGGGLLGRAISYQLAQSGLQTACIYRQGDSRGQASSAAGGMFGVFSEVSANDPLEKSRLEVEQRWLARQLYADWVARICEHSGFPIEMRDGLFVIANAAGEDDLAELAAIRDAAYQQRRQAESVPPGTVSGLNPAASKAAFEALFLPDEGSVDTGQLLAALEDCLQTQSNAHLVNDRALSLAFEGDSAVSIKLESAEIIYGQQVILACGSEMNRLLYDSKWLDLNIPPIFSGRGVSLIVDTPIRFPYPIRTPNRGFACGLHVVPRANAQTYIGATNRFSTTPDFEQKAQLGEINNLLIGAIHEINPGFRTAELVSVSVGHRPVTLDKLPVVGRSEDKRVLVASGTYRNGVLLTPLVAKLITEEILEPGKHTAHPFSPRRPLFSRAHPEEWLRRVSRNLIVTLLEPGGFLPNGRDRDLEHFFYVVFDLLLNPDGDHSGLTQKISRLMQRAPIEENVPLLFDLIARTGVPRANDDH